MKHARLLFSRFALLPLLLFALLPGCKKDDPPETPPAFDRAKVLGTWIEKESWTYDGLSSTLVLHNEPCDGDAEYTFSTDGSYRYFDGTPCDFPFALDLPGQWAIIGTAPHIQIKLEGLEDEPIDLMVDAVTDTEMTLHTIWPSDPAAKAEDKIVLKRK